MKTPRVPTTHTGDGAVPGEVNRGEKRGLEKPKFESSLTTCACKVEDGVGVIESNADCNRRTGTVSAIGETKRRQIGGESKKREDKGND